MKVQGVHILATTSNRAKDTISHTIRSSDVPNPSSRCGLKDPNGTVTQNNFCFCDDPLDQPGITYMYHMLISNNVWANPWPGPWQWTVDNSSRSTLLDPANPSFMRLKSMIEEAVRDTKS